MLRAEGISHTYANGVQALREFSLLVRRGEVVAIVGPSGCGKSTLLRILAGLQQPMAGAVVLDGETITAPSPKVSLMFQDSALLPWRTVRQNVALPLELRRAGQQAAIDHVIELVGLTEFAHALPNEISGGMAQRTALARALVLQPPLLLLDEPFGALDAFTREALTLSLAEIGRKSDTTIVMVTHSITEAVFLADRVIVSTARPGQIAATVPITLPRPRVWDMQRWPQFGALVGAVRDAMKSG
jgi:NitT/TauT family transport system ATP-binding protein